MTPPRRQVGQCPLNPDRGVESGLWLTELIPEIRPTEHDRDVPAPRGEKQGNVAHWKRRGRGHVRRLAHKRPHRDLSPVLNHLTLAQYIRGGCLELFSPTHLP